MQIAIRKVKPEDAKIFAELAKQTFYDTFTGTCTEKDMEDYLKDNYNLSKVEQELAIPGCYNLFAEIDHIPVGYIRFAEDYETFIDRKKYKALELKRLYIQTAFQGKGVAQQLMDSYFQYAKENAFNIAWLSVWEFNFKAQHFYQKYWFEYSGYQHPFPIGNTPQTDLWFWRPL